MIYTFNTWLQPASRNKGLRSKHWLFNFLKQGEKKKHMSDLWSAACPLELIKMSKTKARQPETWDYNHSTYCWRSLTSSFHLDSLVIQMMVQKKVLVLIEPSEAEHSTHLKSLNLQPCFPHLCSEFPCLNFNLTTPKLSKCTTPEVNIKLVRPRQIDVYLAVITHFIWRHFYIWKNDDDR